MNFPSGFDFGYNISTDLFRFTSLLVFWKQKGENVK